MLSELFRVRLNIFSVMLYVSYVSNVKRLDKIIILNGIKKR